MRPSDQTLDRLHEDFADILAKGKFTVSGPLEENSPRAGLGGPAPPGFRLYPE